MSWKILRWVLLLVLLAGLGYAFVVIFYPITLVLIGSYRDHVIATLVLVVMYLTARETAR